MHRTVQARIGGDDFRRAGASIGYLGWHSLTTGQVLKSLVVAYLSPDTAENQELRQCLAYFFPVYCYSSSVNQGRMRQVRWIGFCSSDI